MTDFVTLKLLVKDDEATKNTSFKEYFFGDYPVYKVNPKVVELFTTKNVLKWHITRNPNNVKSHRIFIEYEELKK